MSDLKLSTAVDSENPIEGDLELTDGQLTLTEETLEATRQRVGIRLKTFLGEWYLDQNIGLPIWQRILVKAPNLGSIASLIRREILGTPGIASVQSVKTNLDRRTRELRVSFSATTKGGGELVNERVVIGV